MKYILCNIETTDILEDQLLYNDILKTLAYNARIKSNKLFQYILVAVPYEIKYFNEDIENKITIFKKNIISNSNDPYIFYSLHKVFGALSNTKIRVIQMLDSKSANIFYTDGSSSKIKEAASFGVVKLLGESSSDEAKFDNFTGTNQLYQEISGKVDDGTNNIGELSGIHAAIKNAGFFSIQIIISDSEYSIKAFREWIYNWEKNHYKTYSNKSISNKELIQSIKKDIDGSGKIFLYKWVKGHSGDFFNECCDKLAKKELDILK